MRARHRFRSVDGVRLHRLELGHSDRRAPLVLLHGLPFEEELARLAAMSGRPGSARALGRTVTNSGHCPHCDETAAFERALRRFLDAPHVPAARRVACASAPPATSDATRRSA